MKLMVAGVVATLTLVVAAANGAVTSTPAPELNTVASRIAGQPIEVRCWREEPPADDDAVPWAWGYVYPTQNTVYLGPLPCAGALALAHHEFAPLWQLGLGALILTHESYHLKIGLPWWRRTNEAQTECRAIKRVPQTLVDFGVDPDLADAILPWAIAEHFKESTYDIYDYPSCRVPGFGFWP